MLKPKPIHRQESLYIYKKSRAAGIIRLAVISVILIIWFGNLFARISTPVSVGTHPADAWVILLFSLATVPLIPEIGRAIQRIQTGDAITFDFKRQLLETGAQQIPFADVDHVDVRELPDPDGGKRYQLTLVLTDGESKWIEQFSDYHAVYEIASQIARVLRVPIQQHGNPVS